ncbi:MAG TPA: hypothetical protein VGC46_03010 [Allosphingosinicella sp.]
MISLLATLLFASQPAGDLLRYPSALNAETKALAQPYWDCVMRRVREFEASSEAAGEVAEAAITSCRDARMELQAGIDLDFLFGPQSQRFQNALPTDEVMRDFDQEVRAAARLSVIQIRAERARR